MLVELTRNSEGQAIGWTMKAETPDEIWTVNTIRNLEFGGADDEVIRYNGRKDSDDRNNNAGTLMWLQKREQLKNEIIHQRKLKNMKRVWTKLALIISIVSSIIATAWLTSCTDNTIARNYGGTEVIELRQGERFENITWKEENLWMVVYDSISGDYKAREKSSYGVWEGQIVIKPYGSVYNNHLAPGVVKPQK